MKYDFQKYLGKAAIIDDTDRIVTFDDLLSFQNDIKAAAPKRSVVFVLSRNVCATMAAYVSFIGIDIVPVMLAADSNREMLDNLTDTYHPAYFWMPDDMVEGFTYEKVYGQFGYSLLKTGLEPYPIHKDVGLLLTTSGSTGSPKLVRLSYKNIDGFEEVVLNYCPLYHDNHHISTMPIYHNYDLLALSRLLYHGDYCLLTSKSVISPDFWKFFKKYKADSFGSVPFIYELLEKIKFRDMGIKLQYSSEGGGSMSRDMYDKYCQWHHDNGSDFFTIYGATEAPGGLLVLFGEDTLKKPGSIGKPIKPGRADLIDDDGNVITQPNVTGEIVYTGPIVCMGYAQCGEDLIKEDEYNDVFHTGDMAYFDEDGFYFIVGRKARFLKLLGERVSMDETEKLLSAELGGMEVACLGVDNKMSVFVTDDSDEVKTKATMFLISTLKISPTLFKVKYSAEMPRLATGKIDYSNLATRD